MSLQIKIISFYGEHANLKVDKIMPDGSHEEIFMDPVRIGDEVILEDIPLN